MEIILVSACLVGLATRYDGKSKKSAACMAELANVIWVPVCPEQLGGLSTPRTAADIIGGDGLDVLNGRARVVCRDETDVSQNFIKGANMVLEIAKSLPVKRVFLKGLSPSCAVSGNCGVTAALLKQNNFSLLEF
jgi:uncharacterized protein YbbK (DUF523 family)